VEVGGGGGLVVGWGWVGGRGWGLDFTGVVCLCFGGVGGVFGGGGGGLGLALSWVGLLGLCWWSFACCWGVVLGTVFLQKDPSRAGLLSHPPYRTPHREIIPVS